jgi:hypothetical protein
LQGGKIEFVLSADSDEECLAWVSELRNNIFINYYYFIFIVSKQLNQQ